MAHGDSVNASVHPVGHDSPWLRVSEAATYARCGKRVLYRAVVARQLKAVRLGGRRELRLRVEWVDSWLESLTREEAPEQRRDR